MTMDEQSGAMARMFSEMGFDQAHKLPVAGFRALMRQNLADPSVTRAGLAAVEDRSIPGPAQAIPVRIYRPATALGPLPVQVFYHGGGFVIGDLDIYDALCCELTRRAGCISVSVDYRLAPECPFPAAVDDALAALNWVARHATELGADPARIVVGGDSAGANLSAVVALRAKAAGGPSIALQVLAYPVTEQVDELPSRYRYAEGHGLERSVMTWFTEQYLPDPADRLHPDASPLRAPDLSGLPPALVITAGCDPLSDEGEAYARRLKEAQVAVTLSRYEGTIHGFVAMYGMIDQGNAALDEWAGAIARL